MNRKSTALYLILLLNVFAQIIVRSEIYLAQSPPVSGQVPKPFASPSIKDFFDSKPYVSIDLAYSILLPKPTYSNNWIFQEGKIAISITNANNVDGKQNLKGFTEINNRLLLSRVQGKVTDEKYSEADNLYSSVTYFTFDDGKSGIRKFSLADDRLYIIFAQFTDSADGFFFDSALKTFKIVGEAEIKSEIQRRFEEATPADLPQEPLPKNYQSDAKEENLKGKVKKIVEENEDIDRKNRKISQTREYNKMGNLTKVVRIDYRENPASIEVYGFIDGKRVSKTGYIEYPYNPPSPAAIPSKIQPEPKRDLRYTTSYEKKYRDGKLTEKVFYGNNGVVWLRQISNYKNDQLEFLVYSSDGKLSQKYVSTLDKNGLVIEETSFDVVTQKPNTDRKYRYIYEFDKTGNWIKKTTSREVSEEGKTFFKPLYIYYRTISYY